MEELGEVYGMDLRKGGKKQELLNSISLLEGKMLEAKHINFSEVESQLFYAKMMLEGECYDDAGEMIEKCREALDKKMLRYDLLVSTIEKAKRQMSRAEEMEGDLSLARAQLDQAERYFTSGEYKKGVSHAMKAVEAAKAEVSKYKSWRTELDSWKE